MPYQLSSCPSRVLPSSSSMKRERTKFHPNQLQILERFFERKMYPDGYERERLAQTLALTETKIQIWFKNRRAKQRAQKHLENMIRAKQDLTGKEKVKDENVIESPPPEPKHEANEEKKPIEKTISEKVEPHPIESSSATMNGIASSADVNFKLHGAGDPNFTPLPANVTAWMPMSYPITQYANVYVNGFGFYSQAHNGSQYPTTPYDFYGHPSYYNTSDYS
uniref:Homeobox domain-containing protein n=1 Tax=Acrobeloides nanus TaxID=290746 RepID=A0A914C5B2_9BILA